MSPSVSQILQTLALYSLVIICLHERTFPWVFPLSTRARDYIPFCLSVGILLISSPTQVGLKCYVSQSSAIPFE